MVSEELKFIADKILGEPWNIRDEKVRNHSVDIRLCNFIDIDIDINNNLFTFPFDFYYNGIGPRERIKQTDSWDEEFRKVLNGGNHERTKS